MVALLLLLLLLLLFQTCLILFLTSPGGRGLTHSVILFLQVRNCSYRVGERLSQSRSVSEPKLDTPSGFPFKQPRHSDVQSSKQTSMVQSVWEGSRASSSPGIVLLTLLTKPLGDKGKSCYSGMKSSRSQAHLEQC